MVIMRARFDAYKDETDPRKATLLLADGFKQLHKRKHLKPFRFPNEPGGANYDRAMDLPDVLLDHWSPLEKEQFPYYFNRREQRKKELLEHWHKIEKSWDEEIEAIQTKLPEEKPAQSTKQIDQK
ncbi:NADH dehydrogenase [ubiquinone] 1 beta subcomplex subunit 9 [Ditylenchus destructor]|nr:NADH dehydrogenase [ubiquinone] 1 beta subcomplex subunit 9 [Ditylenchus destructor]